MCVCVCHVTHSVKLSASSIKIHIVCLSYVFSVHACVCACRYACVNSACIRVCVYTYTHTHIHAYAHMRVCVYVYAREKVYVRVIKCSSACTRVRVGVIYQKEMQVE